MKIKIMNRQLLSASIIIFYLIPLLFFSAYSISLMSHHKSWTVLSLGLLLIVLGTLALMLLVFYWEQSVRNKKQTSLLSPVQIIPHPSILDKEAKVTSIDPSLIFNSMTSHETAEHIGFKESSKEFNLLQTALKTNQEQVERLTKSLESKNQEFQKQEEENKQLHLKVQQTAQDFADYKLFSEEQLKQKQLQLTSLQQLLEDQRSEMEKRQEQISQLDTKVHDLSYEIKTLLYLHEEEITPPKSNLSTKQADISHSFLYKDLMENEEASDMVSETPLSYDTSIKSLRTSLEAVTLLKKCINIAQKLTGSNYYSNESSRYREFSSSYFAIDQRRLFDNLRSETGALIIVHSQKENKVLFVNNETKNMLGWSPEKFLADFPSIMQENINDWKKALNTLTTNSEAQARLLAKTKNGQELLLNCHLGIIQSGLFRHYVIGVLYPT